MPKQSGTQALVSAEVILDVPLPADADIVAGEAARFKPDPQRAETLRRAYEQSGFTVGPVVGVSFSISGPASLFEKLFQVKLKAGMRGAVGAQARPSAGAAAETTPELPLSKVRRELREGVRTVTFGRVPDFGPGGEF